MQKILSLPYRENVIAVIRGDDDRVLVGERSDHPGAWQLPQGGIDPGENHDDALRREVAEETGIETIVIVKKAASAICYDFPQGGDFGEIGKKFRGQRQWWFLCELMEGKTWSLELSDGEFAQIAWMPPEELLDKIIWWKKDAYREGFQRLGFDVR